MSDDVSEETWKELLIRDDYKCLNCNSEKDLTVAHYVVRHYGGHSLDNLMLLCFDCHRKQHARKLLIKKIGGRFYFKPIK